MEERPVVAKALVTEHPVDNGAGRGGRLTRLEDADASRVDELSGGGSGGGGHGGKVRR